MTITNHNSKRCPGKSLVLLLVLAGSAAAFCTIHNQYPSQIRVLSDQILLNAQQLREQTFGDAHSANAEATLARLKDLIEQYEGLMLLERSPYPGEILLGTTPPGDSTWLETLCNTRHSPLLKEIRIRRTGRRANYLRINDIEITYATPRGPWQQTFNENGRIKLHHGGVFQLALPKPMRVARVRININHESTGLEVYGVPYHPNPMTPYIEDNHPNEVLLGVTPPGHSTYLETLCHSPYDLPIREIRLRRTGSRASYIRINDIEVIYRTGFGTVEQTFNRNGRVKLHPDGVFTLALPRPLRIIRIRILIDHESSGLKVYGVH